MSIGNETALAPSALRKELLEALSPAAREGDPADPWRFRVVLRRIVGQAWRCVAGSDFSALRELLRLLIEAQERVRSSLPEPGPPQVEAAREVHFAAWALHIAESFVRPAPTVARLEDRQRSESERKVLRVLLENRGRYLRRKEILDEMERLRLPLIEATRLSQILSDLLDEQLLTRILASAQGNAQTSHFALSGHGLALCEKLGLAEPRSLFEPDESKWRSLLHRRRLVATQDQESEIRRIATFYRPRPGVGSPFIVAQCARLLSRSLKDSEPPKVLVLDLEGEESPLPDHLEIDDAMEYQGMAGLLTGYYGQADDKRSGWLASAIFEPPYACRVGKENLYYLPALRKRPDSDSSHGYAMLLRDLRREIEVQPRTENGAPKTPAVGFLSDLRKALTGSCTKALIQSPCGLGPASYMATALLAEELVLVLNPDDDRRRGVRRTLRELIGNCLWREEGLQAGPTPLFVFSRVPDKVRYRDLSPTIEHLFLDGDQEEYADSQTYRLFWLSYDERVALDATQLDPRRDHSALAAAYRDLVEALHPYISAPPVQIWENEQTMGALTESPAPLAELVESVEVEVKAAKGPSDEQMEAMDKLAMMAA